MDPHHPAGAAGSRPAMSRRAFGGLLGLTTTAAAAATVGATPAAASAVRETPFRAAGHATGFRRPNILFVLGDDLGWGDLSSYGSPDIKTPQLDRLAQQGVRFTNAYAGSSTCSPTRFSLYTGRFPGRTVGGLEEPIGDKAHGLDPAHPTLASLLRDAGYTTAMVGKWHCGALPRYSPTRSGWSEFFGNLNGALEYYSKINDLGEYDLWEGDAEYRDLRYYTRILTERASAFISRKHDRPWLLNLNYTTPHWPWIAEGDTEESAALNRRIGAEPAFEVLKHNDGGSIAKYAEMVQGLDSSIGEVLAALSRSGQDRDTIVVFSSDNGGERWSYQWPLTGEKFSLREGGIRVPTIVRWPGRINGGQRSDEPVYTQDWTATLLDVGGAEPAPGYPPRRRQPQELPAAGRGARTA